MTPGEEIRDDGGHGQEWESGIAPQDAAAEQYAGTSLRLQVLEIIGSLLNSTGPELEEVRGRLRNLVKEHPWHPEIALLRHLSDLHPPVAAPWTADTPAMPLTAVQAGEPPQEPSPGWSA